MPQLFASSSSFFASVRSVSLGVGWWRTQHLFFFSLSLFFFSFLFFFFFLSFFLPFFFSCFRPFPCENDYSVVSPKKKKKDAFAGRLRGGFSLSWSVSRLYTYIHSYIHGQRPTHDPETHQKCQRLNLMSFPPPSLPLLRRLIRSHRHRAVCGSELLGGGGGGEGGGRGDRTATTEAAAQTRGPKEKPEDGGDGAEGEVLAGSVWRHEYDTYVSAYVCM